MSIAIKNTENSIKNLSPELIIVEIGIVNLGKYTFSNNLAWLKKVVEVCDTHPEKNNNKTFADI